MSEVPDTAADAIDTLGDGPTPDEVFAATIGFSSREIAATAVTRGGTSTGVPDGGATGQVLVKESNADGDAAWEDGITNPLTADLNAGGHNVTNLGSVVITGKTGATAPVADVGGTTAGPPATGTFAAGDHITAQDGYDWVCTVAGSPGTWTRGSAFEMRKAVAMSARGFLCETWPTPLSVSFATTPTSQTASFLGGSLALLRGDVATGLVFFVGTAGTSTVPTGIYVGLYTAAGVRLAVSSNLAASSIWTTQGYAYAPFSGTYTSTSDQAVYALFLQNGSWAGTAHKMWGGQPSTLHNTAPTGGSQYAVAKSATGQSTPPADMSSVTNATHQTYWCAIY